MYPVLESSVHRSADYISIRDYEDDLPIPLEVLGDRNVMEVGIEVVEAKRHLDIARNALIDAHKAEKKAKEEDKGDKNEDKVATESKAGAGEEEKVKDNDDTKKENKDDENEEDHEEKKDDDDAAKTEDDKTNESEAGGKGEAEDGNSSDSGSDGADHDGPIKIGDHEIEEESDVPDHEFVRCDGCGVSPVKGPRFKCIEYVASTRFRFVLVH